jgi:hypothetical protein
MKPHDFRRDVDELKTFVVQICLHPPSWGAFNCIFNLKWNWIKFEDDKSWVPATRGVYAFVVEPDLTDVFPVAIPFYVGETGNMNSRTLRDRYSEYLTNKRRICERHGIHYMLNKWCSHLYFYFAEVSDAKVSLKDIEASLNDALLPPYSVRDFSATVRPKVRALRL